MRAAWLAMQQALRTAYHTAAAHAPAAVLGSALPAQGTAATPAAVLAQASRQTLRRCFSAETTKVVVKPGGAANQEGKGGGGSAESTAWSAIKGMLQSRVVLVLVGATGLVVLNVRTESTMREYYKKLVLRRVREGFITVNPPELPPIKPIPRDDLRRELRTILWQKPPTHAFYAIQGPHGCGKTTLLREVVAELGGGIGYVGVDPLPDSNFGADLGAAINFTFHEHMSLFNFFSQIATGTKLQEDTSNPRTLQRSARALQDAAREFKAQTGRPFVLVIDDVDRLRVKRDDVIAALQEYAGDWAEEGIITLVFVCDNPTTLEFIEKGSATRSHRLQTLFVGDVSEAAAVDYLRRRGASERAAREIAGMAGGRLLGLQIAGDLLLKGMPLEKVKKQLLESAELEFDAAGMLAATPQQQPGLRAVHAMLHSCRQGLMGRLLGRPCDPSCKVGFISIAEWRRLVPCPEHREALLRGHVFRLDFDEVSFESRTAEVYARELLPHRLPDYPRLVQGRG